MANLDTPLAHHYDSPVAPKLSNDHPGSELLSITESASYDHAVGGGIFTEARGMAMASVCDNVSLPAQEPLVGDSNLDMAATARSCPLQDQSLQMQQQQHSHARHLYLQRCQPHADVSNSGAGATTTQKPIRRRMRMITSCLECRRRKLKCNKSQPCSNCLKFSRDCLYLGPKLDEASQLRLTEIKEKVGSLERQLERDVAKSGVEFGRAGVRGLSQQRMLVDDVEGVVNEADDLGDTAMATLDLMYGDDEPNVPDDVMDLGVRVGRMKLTEKIEGMNRPRISEEIQAGLSGSVPHFEGFSTGLGSPRFDIPPTSQSGPSSESSECDQSLPDYLRPGTSYLAPTSGVFFGQVGQSPPLLSFLPTRPAGDRLLEQYFDAVHPIARCVHRSCFKTQYSEFWEEVEAGYEPPSPAQAVVFAAWFNAAITMDEHAIHRELGFSKATLVGHMKFATELALSKANFLRTTKVQTLQAFVMYMIPLCREEVSRAHSVLVGAAVRMAECMGLHRDGKKYNLNPLETHIRRLIWHQLCFLDIRTCEVQGPRPTIRREDYDCCLPDNSEEDELSPDASPSATSNPPSEGWTSILLPLIRFEINEMMRTVWADRYKLASGNITITQALTKIETFRKRMLASYDHLLDERVPIQRYAKVVMHLLLYRLRVMFLHPYYAHTTSAMPARLRSILIMSGIMVTELAIPLDTDPAFRLWRWYAGAYQQYQAALMLVTEIYYHPTHKEAERIWMCLKYVFELDDNVNTREQQAIQILAEVAEKMGAYVNMRKLRAPIAAVSARPPVHHQALKSEEASSVPREKSGPTSRPSELQQDQPQRRNTRLPMKVETGIASLARPGPRSGSSSYYSCSPDSGTPTSSCSQLQQQQQLAAATSGSESSPRWPHLPPRGTSMPNAAAAAAAMANGMREESLWSLLPPSLHNTNSPGNSSSSDNGSVIGSHGGGQQRQGSLGGMRTAMLGGSPPHVMEGQWPSNQEDAINVVFPFDQQSGSFAGLHDQMTDVANHDSSWTQP